MRYKGDVKTIGNQFIQDYKDNKYDKTKKYEMKIEEVKSDRSLNANAYYWRMLRDYARYMRIGQTEMHNRILGEAGFLLKDMNDKPITVLLDINYEYLKDETIHLKPTGSIVNTDKGEKQLYYVLRESKTFNTQEFSELIDILRNDIIGNGFDNIIDIRE